MCPVMAESGKSHKGVAGRSLYRIGWASAWYLFSTTTTDIMAESRNHRQDPTSVLRPFGWFCEEYPPKVETTSSLRISSGSSSYRVQMNVPQLRNLIHLILSDKQINRLCVAERVENGPSPVERRIRDWHVLSPWSNETTWFSPG